MIEAIMMFALGFLVAAAGALAALPAVWNRAVRLTRRRIESLVPVSLSEIEADKDQLRATYAVAMRRLEIKTEAARGKLASHLVELGRKSMVIVNLKAELAMKDAAIQALEAQEKSLRAELAAREAELSTRTTALGDADSRLSDTKTSIAALQRTLDETIAQSDVQKTRIAALSIEAGNLKGRLSALDQERSAFAEAAARDRAAADEARRAFDEERQQSETMARRIAELEGKLAALSRAKTAAQERIFALENQAQVHDTRLREADDAVADARRGAAEARMAEQEARQMAERLNRAVEALQAQNADLERALVTAGQDDIRLQAGLFEAPSNGDDADTALLRERISDVAAEVARLTAQLEGPGSPIHALVGNAPSLNGAAVADGEAAPAATLADRIRALQSLARAP